MSTYKKKGFLCGIIGAVSYGLNPLFALPMYQSGLSANSVLFYRYLFAVLIYGFWLGFFKRISLKINLKEFVCLLFLSILFALSSLTLFDAFNYIDSGIACTILFMYPIFVVLISSLFFREKITKTTVFSVLLTTLGIFLLYGGAEFALNLKGVFLVVISALCYAFYIIGVKNLKPVKHIRYDKMSFYVMLLGLSVFIFNLKFCHGLEAISDIKTLICALLLAIFPTIVSLEAINVAIRLIGASNASILGALEPLTALFCGVLFFKESLTIKILAGVVLIIGGVFNLIKKKIN